MHSSPIRQQVITDMKVAGLSAATQESYLGIMDRFFRKAWLAPEQITEAMVRDYLNGEIARGVGHGSFKPTRFALQFLFENTLQRDWDLFKKEWPLPSGSVCPRCPRKGNAGGF